MLTRCKNDSVKLTILKNHHMDPKIVSLSLQEVTIIQELPNFRNLSLGYDLFDLEDDLRCSYCRLCELAVLKNPTLIPRLYL